jgi:hypothetical protein
MHQERAGQSLGPRLAAPAALLLLVSCYSLYEGRDAYSEGMQRLRYDPASAAAYFAEAEQELGEAIAGGDLQPGELVLAVTLRARSLIELERHTDAAAVLATPIQGYTPDSRFSGDAIGLSLLRASKLDPERAYAELLLAEKKAATLRARLHVAWEQVHVLQKIGTAQAKAEAVKICDAHKGKLDFDALKQSLQNP